MWDSDSIIIRRIGQGDGRVAMCLHRYVAFGIYGQLLIGAN